MVMEEIKMEFAKEFISVDDLNRFMEENQSLYKFLGCLKQDGMTGARLLTRLSIWFV
jgi:hypothetical protein